MVAADRGRNRGIDADVAVDVGARAASKPAISVLAAGDGPGVDDPGRAGLRKGDHPAVAAEIMLGGDVDIGMKPSKLAAESSPACPVKAFRLWLLTLSVSAAIARLGIAVDLGAGVIDRHDRARLKSCERHQIARLGAGDCMVPMRVGSHVADDADAGDAVAVVSVADIGLAEEPAHAEATVSPDLPSPPAVAGVAGAERNLRAAIIAGNSQHAARYAIFGTHRAAQALDLERAN